MTRQHEIQSLLHALWLAFALSCSSTNQRAPTPPLAESAATDRQALRPVTLPDLSRVSPSVRQQLTEQYAALTAAIEKTTVPDAELGAAYGEMGKLLMAAEFPAEAEPLYLNAQALAPGDPRWSVLSGPLVPRSGRYSQGGSPFPANTATAVRRRPRADLAG